MFYRTCRVRLRGPLFMPPAWSVTKPQRGSTAHGPYQRYVSVICTRPMHIRCGCIPNELYNPLLISWDFALARPLESPCEIPHPTTIQEELLKARNMFQMRISKEYADIRAETRVRKLEGRCNPPCSDDPDDSYSYASVVLGLSVIGYVLCFRFGHVRARGICMAPGCMCFACVCMHACMTVCMSGSLDGCMCFACVVMYVCVCFLGTREVIRLCLLWSCVGLQIFYLVLWRRCFLRLALLIAWSSLWRPPRALVL
jgi:hypothetical protein